MNKTILCTVICSVFSLNASAAAVLNVEGEIQVNGTTVLETINLENYEAAEQVTQTYTAYSCHNYSNGEEKDCGTFTKTITITSDADNNEQEIEEIKDHNDDLVSRDVFTRTGDQYSSQGESYTKGTYPIWEQEYWADVNGTPITINGMPAFEGMSNGECNEWDPSVSDACIDTNWYPDLEKGDQKMGGNKQVPSVNVNKWSSSWTEVSLKERNHSAIVIGLPSVSIWQESNNQSTYENWIEVEGKDEHVDYYQGSNDNLNPTVHHRAYTVIGKVAAYNGYQGCIIIERENGNKVKCIGKGTVSFTGESGNQYAPGGKDLTWTLAQ